MKPPTAKLPPNYRQCSQPPNRQPPICKGGGGGGSSGGNNRQQGIRPQRFYGDGEKRRAVSLDDLDTLFEGGKRQLARNGKSSASNSAKFPRMNWRKLHC